MAGVRWRAALLGLSALGLGACQSGPEPAPPAPPPVVMVQPEAPPPRPLPLPQDLPRSEVSLALSDYYARLQNDLVAQGLLRGDAAPADAPFTDTQLARDFLQIALFDEYIPGAGLSRDGAQEGRLRRWQGPIRMEVRFGATVPLAQATRDRATVATYAARLSRITGVPITLTQDQANFHVLFLTEDDRRGFEPELRRLLPGIGEASVRAVMNLPRSTYCLVISVGDETGSVYSRAVALIRAEHPELLRTACIHEELAQGMGLVNDSPVARPSIFNDNNEFGRLTRHDELLLKLLYDQRLRPGMTAPEATPLVQAIAAELMVTGDRGG